MANKLIREKKPNPPPLRKPAKERPPGKPKPSQMVGHPPARVFHSFVLKSRRFDLSSIPWPTNSSERKSQTLRLFENPRRSGHPENQNRLKGWATRQRQLQNRLDTNRPSHGRTWPTC